MAVSANDLVALLQADGLPVNGVTIRDVDDPTTWSVTGPLTQQQLDRAIELIAVLLQPSVVPTRTVPRLEFLRMLTPQEYMTLKTDATTDPIICWGLALLEAAAGVATTDTAFQQLLAYFVSTERVTQERVDEILAAMVAYLG